MDGGSRTTRKLRYRDARRLTRRQQRGGSAIIVPMELPAEDPRIVMLREILSTDEELKFILPSVGAATIDDATKAKHYYTIIRRQDDILQAVLKTIYKMVGVTSNPPVADEIISKWGTIKDTETKKEEIYDLVKFARNMIILNKNDKTLVTISSGNPLATGKTRPKLDDFIFTKTSERAKSGMDILEVMLYPKRLTNIFVECVASIIQELSSTPENALKSITNASPELRDTLIALLALQYAAYIRSVSNIETNNNERDFISTMSNKPEAADIYTGFFRDFISVVTTRESPTINSRITAGALAGIIFKQYKEGGAVALTSRVLTTIKTTGIVTRSTLEGTNTLFGLPDEQYTTHPLIEDITFGDIINRICNPALADSGEKLHFLLHLLYKLEHSTAPETVPPTTLETSE